MAKQALVVTTEYKGVFFGYGEAQEGKTIELDNARMCVYWNEATKGVVGLAAIGPQVGCRITPAAPKIMLEGVTAKMTCSEVAVKQWEKELW